MQFFSFFQGILHHVSQISDKKDEVENAAKQSKVQVVIHYIILCYLNQHIATKTVVNKLKSYVEVSLFGPVGLTGEI